MPFTRVIAGTSIGPVAAAVPLSFAAIPYFARLVEQCLREVPRGVIEAAHAAGASELQIVRRVLLVEARSGLVPVSYTHLVGSAAISAVPEALCQAEKVSRSEPTEPELKLLTPSMR